MTLLDPAPTTRGPSCHVSPVGCLLWAGILLLLAWGLGAIWLWVTS